MSVRYRIKSGLKKITKSTAFIRCVAFFIYLYSKFVGLTCHWQYKNVSVLQQDLKDTGAIFVVWHSRAVLMPFFYRHLSHRKMSALVSPHQDGQLIAYMLKHFKIVPINGSSNENAHGSAVELMHSIQNGYDICISPDGPRGPRMRMKKSPIYYASKTGRPIVCACFSTNSAKIINTSWDKTMIPLPFAKGIFSLTKPLYIPANTSDEDLEIYRLKLEDIANRQVFECDEAVGRDVMLPADMDDFKKKEQL